MRALHHARDSLPLVKLHSSPQGDHIASPELVKVYAELVSEDSFTTSRYCWVEGRLHGAVTPALPVSCL